VKGQAGRGLLESYTAGRARIAKQIVARANQSITEFGPILGALGMDGGVDHDNIRRNMDARCDASDTGEAQRAALRKAIAFKSHEFDAHGVEMNQRHRSTAVATDGPPEPAVDRDMELHYQPTTWPGARLPHVWIYAPSGARVSTLDICGHGTFTLLTGIGGTPWIAAAQGLGIQVRIIGPRQVYEDHTGDWARAREVGDAGCVLVRPDHHVCWRSVGLTGDPVAALTRVMRAVLA